MHWIPLRQPDGHAAPGNPGMAQCFFPQVNIVNLTYGQFAWVRGERMPGCNPLT